MRIFEIIDAEMERSVGILMYYEHEKSFIIELEPDLDEWNAPLACLGQIRQGIYTIPKDISFMWVRGRIIPNNRQNISSILATHNLKEYDEMKFLEISEGKCCQDACYIRRIDKLPEYVLKRQKKNLKECMVTSDSCLLCVFVDDTLKKVDLSKLKECEEVDKILKNKALLESAKVGTGGYSVVFNDSIDIPAYELYKYGKTIPLKLADLVAFVQKNVVDTTECSYMLDCSRQNISYLVREENLTPIKLNVKGNLYFKGDVIKNEW